MIMKTVKTSNGMCVAIGEVKFDYSRHVVSVHLDGRQTVFAIDDTTVMGHRLQEGDHVVVKFDPQDQFATLVSMKDVAVSLGYDPVEW